MSDEPVKPHGWKTYTTAGLSIVGGLVGYWLEMLTGGEAVFLVVFGLGLVGVRDALAKLAAERALTAVDRAKEKLSKPTDVPKTLRNNEKGQVTLKQVLALAGGGGGIVFMYLVYDVARHKPELLYRFMEQAPTLILSLALLAVVYQRLGQFAQGVSAGAVAQHRSAAAMESVSDSLTQLAAAQGTELEAIKASLGSLHGKVDDLRAGMTP